MKFLDWLNQHRQELVKVEKRVSYPSCVDTESGTYWDTVYEEVEVVDWDELVEKLAEFEKEFR